MAIVRAVRERTVSPNESQSAGHQGAKQQGDGKCKAATKIVLAKVLRICIKTCEDKTNADPDAPRRGAVPNFFAAGLGDMFSTRDGLLMVARVGIPNSVVQDYARYLTSAEMKVRKQQASGGNKRQVSLQDRANESGLPLE